MTKQYASRGSVWRVAKFIALSAALLGLSAFAVDQTIELGIAKGDLAHQSAKISLYYRMLEKGCTTLEQLEDAVANAGWQAERQKTPYNDNLLNDSEPTALLVYIEPPIPFAVVDWVAYQFDEAGCMTSK